MDPRLDLIDHPQPDPPATANPAFTAAVMGRVRLLPARPPAADARWWWGIAAAAAALLALPWDGAALDLPAIDPALGAEALLLAAAAAAALALTLRRTA